MLQRNINRTSKKETQTSRGRDAILWQIDPCEERKMQARSGPSGYLHWLISRDALPASLLPPALRRLSDQVTLVYKQREAHIKKSAINQF